MLWTWPISCARTTSAISGRNDGGYALVETALVNSYNCYNEMIESGAINGVHAEVTLLDYKRSVTRGLLAVTKESAEKKRGRPRKRVLSGKRGPKRRKNRFSTPDYVRFSGVGGHKRQEFLSVRAWCKWWAVTRKKEARPFSKYTCCGVFLFLGPRRNCFNAHRTFSMLKAREARAVSSSASRSSLPMNKRIQNLKKNCRTESFLNLFVDKFLHVRSKG